MAISDTLARRYAQLPFFFYSSQERKQIRGSSMTHIGRTLRANDHQTRPNRSKLFSELLPGLQKP
jgi:hypothetical protein